MAFYTTLKSTLIVMIVPLMAAYTSSNASQQITSIPTSAEEATATATLAPTNMPVKVAAADATPTPASRGLQPGESRAIARALANTPPVLLADEPTAALDTDSAINVIKLMRETCREHNAILIVASHDPEVAAGFEKTTRLQRGQLTVEEMRQFGPVELASFDGLVNEYIAEFNPT